MEVQNGRIENVLWGMWRYIRRTYKQLLKKHKSILEEYKNLSLLLEDNENNDIEFNAEECKILQKLIQINIDMKQMEEKEIFFLGAKENYFYLKKIGVLK